jgi:hypothetical protein
MKPGQYNMSKVAPLGRSQVEELRNYFHRTSDPACAFDDDPLLARRLIATIDALQARVDELSKLAIGKR